MPSLLANEGLLTLLSKSALLRWTTTTTTLTSTGLWAAGGDQGHRVYADAVGYTELYAHQPDTSSWMRLQGGGSEGLQLEVGGTGASGFVGVERVRVVASVPGECGV